jgi:hypothetical protein
MLLALGNQKGIHNLTKTPRGGHQLENFGVHEASNAHYRNTT